MAERSIEKLSYLVQPVESLLPRVHEGLRVLDLGCGNGFWAGRLAGHGCVVVGVDPSASAIENARSNFPALRFERLDVSEDICGQLGEDPFDLVLSLELVEHLYSPYGWAEGCFRALKPGGRLICSTPYYGCLKNFLLGVMNKWDEHFAALTEGGHIKFFSRKTLTRLLDSVGFEAIRFRGAGRLLYLWKSMVLSADKPTS